MVVEVLLAAILAMDPPEPPVPSEQVDGQCAQSYPLSEGVEPPSELFDGTVASCGGIVVPTSQVADLMAHSVYAEQLHDLYRLHTTELEHQAQDLQSQIEQLSQPVPWVQTAAAQRWIGRSEGLVVGVLAGAVAVYVYSEQSK